jgi:hypothetical protein
VNTRPKGCRKSFSDILSEGKSLSPGKGLHQGSSKFGIS